MHAPKRRESVRKPGRLPLHVDIHYTQYTVYTVLYSLLVSLGCLQKACDSVTGQQHFFFFNSTVVQSEKNRVFERSISLDDMFYGRRQKAETTKKVCL